MRLGLGLGVNSRVQFGGPAPYRTTATSYDGTNDFASKSGVNGANSKQFTFVCALNFTGTAYQWIWDIGSSRLAIARLTSPFYIAIEGATAAGTGILNIRSTNPSTAFQGDWGVLMISLDMSDTNKRHIYIGHTDLGVTQTTYTDGILGLANDYEFGTRIAGANKLAACASHLWYADGTYIDFSVQANRLKFIDAAGKPIDLGDDGSEPTGSQPRVFAPDGNPSTNLGSVGNFTITGAVTTCASSPTD